MKVQSGRPRHRVGRRRRRRAGGVALVVLQEGNADGRSGWAVAGGHWRCTSPSRLQEPEVTSARGRSERDEWLVVLAEAGSGRRLSPRGYYSMAHPSKEGVGWFHRNHTRHWTYLREAGVSDEDVAGGAVVCIFKLVFTLATVLILGGAGVEGDAVEVSTGYKIGALGLVPQVRSLGTANGRGVTLEPREVLVTAQGWTSPGDGAEARLRLGSSDATGAKGKVDWGAAALLVHEKKPSVVEEGVSAAADKCQRKPQKEEEGGALVVGPRERRRKILLFTERRG
ncbi:hypothetical protein B296_00018934 [Ensete ventricosum]|uniref:Uncharacterized protein n=1 Tax=Ensete ventricosum TaxID=4639 RepID=A0A427AYR8_ENSVE|nr:hypothetical protein B296_00018934 [Ensete ventricosum]